VIRRLLLYPLSYEGRLQVYRVDYFWLPVLRYSKEWKRLKWQTKPRDSAKIVES
jgi:hypothetical protein